MSHFVALLRPCFSSRARQLELRPCAPCVHMRVYVGIRVLCEGPIFWIRACEQSEAHRSRAWRPFDWSRPRGPGAGDPEGAACHPRRLRRRTRFVGGGAAVHSGPLCRPASARQRGLGQHSLEVTDQQSGTWGSWGPRAATGVAPWLSPCLLYRRPAGSTGLTGSMMPPLGSSWGPLGSHGPQTVHGVHRVCEVAVPLGRQPMGSNADAHGSPGVRCRRSAGETICCAAHTRVGGGHLWGGRPWGRVERADAPEIQSHRVSAMRAPRTTHRIAVRGGSTRVAAEHSLSPPHLLQYLRLPPQTRQPLSARLGLADGFPGAPFKHCMPCLRILPHALM